MIAAVCCPGPSLPCTWRGRRHYDVVHAVNRALIVVSDADWLCAGDWGVFFDGLLPDEVRPKIGAMTMENVAEAARRLRGWTHLRFDTWQASPLYAEHERLGQPLQWSVQAALCHAAELGAERIDLYGADMNAATPIDCTGYAGESRGPIRWAREERDLAFTFALLVEHRVAVHRVLPGVHDAG